MPGLSQFDRCLESLGCQQEIAFEKNHSRIGSEMTCLVDSIDSKFLAKGRTYGQAPDIDSLCLIKTGRRHKHPPRPGQFIRTKVVGTSDYDLVVEQI